MQLTHIKNLLFIVLLTFSVVILLCCCYKNDKTRPIPEGNDLPPYATLHDEGSTGSLPASFPLQGTHTQAWPTDSKQELYIDDTNDSTLYVGKLFDSSSEQLALYIVSDSLIGFYRPNKEKQVWENIYTHKSQITTCYIYFERLNASPDFQLVLSTCYNMNCNRWLEVVGFNEQSQTPYFAGSLNTDYEVDTVSNTIRVTYEGSHYMTREKAAYQWINGRLILLRAVGITPPEDYWSDTPSKATIAYYENRNLRFPADNTLVFEEPYDSNSKKHQTYWDHFFEL